MTTSSANVQPTNMELTPCRVKLGGVDLGGTLGNVKASITVKKGGEIKADQFGETVIDRRVSGYEFKIETVISQIQDKALWKAVFPNMKKVGTGPYAMYADSNIGESDLALAQVLILHPLSKADADLSGDYTFFKATAESASEITFGPTEQQGLKVVFNVYPDTSVQPAKFMMFGDSTIGIVHAVAGAPVFVGTGNGAMTAVTAYDGQTATESIVVKCVGVPAADKSNWTVVGSVSGILGYFEISTGSFSFVSPKISFSLADGTTDFVIGDNFTIATTAANYV